MSLHKWPWPTAVSPEQHLTLPVAHWPPFCTPQTNSPLQTALLVEPAEQSMSEWRWSLQRCYSQDVLHTTPVPMQQLPIPSMLINSIMRAFLEDCFFQSRCGPLILMILLLLFMIQRTVICNHKRTEEKATSGPASLPLKHCYWDPPGIWLKHSNSI